jgi:DMSO/TMAO reductase YedYZ heme-binding membrane subunit
MMRPQWLISRLVPVIAAAAVALLPVAAWAATPASTGANIPWYLSRATGFVAYLLLFATVVLGLSIRTKSLDRLVARWRITDIHTFLSVLVVLFVCVHVAVLLGDSFIGFSVVQLLVPFASAYLPVWTGIGIISAYLLLLVAVSFPARRFTGYRFWRSLHYLTFVVYLGALVHALFTGTDSRVGWAQLVYISTAGVVLALVLYRIISWSRREVTALTPRPRPVQPLLQQRVLATAGARAAFAKAPVLVPAPSEEVLAERRAGIETKALGLGILAVGLVMLIFFAAGIGPFRWGQGSAATINADSAAGVTQPAAGFQDSYSGTIVQGRSSLEMTLTASGQRPVALDIQLQLARGAEGGTSVVGNSATLTDANGATLCSGQVTSLDNSGFQIACQGAGPYAGRSLALQGSIDGGAGNQIQGSLQASVTSN